MRRYAGAGVTRLERYPYATQTTWIRREIWMPKLKLTQACVDGLQPPKSGRVEYWDSLLPGFGLRVAASGKKTWQAFYRVDGKMVREKIGTVDLIPNVGVARDHARESMTAVRRGENPAEQKRQAKAEEKRRAEEEAR